MGYRRTYDRKQLNKRRNFNTTSSDNVASIVRDSVFDFHSNSLPDNFTNTNGVELYRHNEFWCKPNAMTANNATESQLVIASNRLHNTSTDQAFRYYLIPPNEPNYYIEGSFYIDVNDSFEARIFARFIDGYLDDGSGPTAICALLSSDGSGECWLALTTWNNGTDLLISSNVSIGTSFAAGQTIRVGLKVVGDTYTAYYGNQIVAQVTYSRTASPSEIVAPIGHVGFGLPADGGSGSPVNLDSFFATGIGQSNILQGTASLTFTPAANIWSNQKPMTVRRTALEFSQDPYDDSFTYSAGELSSVSSSIWTKNTDITATPLVNVTAAGRIRSAATDTTVNIQAYRLSTPAPYRADYAVEADVYVAALPSAGSFGAAISARQQAGSTSRYRFVINVTQAGAVNLYLYQTNSLIGSRNNYITGISAGQTYRLRLQTYSTSIRAYLDDVEIFNVTNATITGTGTAGVEFNNATGTDTPSDSNLLQIDNVRVTKSKGIAILVDKNSQISGNASLTFGQSGSLTGKGLISGNASLTFGQSGSLTGKASISGNAGLTFGQSGSLAGVSLASGNASLTFGSKNYLLNNDTYNQMPDPFTGTDGTTLQAYSAKWIRQSFSAPGDNAVIQNNHAVGGVGNVYYYHDATPINADYSVIADGYVNDSPSTSTHWVGVVGRFAVGTNTGYFAQITYSGGSNQIELWKNVSGTATQLGSSIPVSLNVGDWFNLRLEMIGTTIKVHYNLTEVISVTDSSVTSAGKSGLFFETSGADSHYHLDNFHASNMVLSSVSLISGTASLTFGQSANITGVASISGNADLTFGQSGNLAGVAPISGNADLTFGQSGVLSAIAPISGSASLNFATTANLIGVGVMTGVSALTFGADGSITGVGLIGGVSHFEFGTQASLTGLAFIDGTASLTFGANASLAGVSFITGVAPVSFNAQGSLTGVAPIVGETAFSFGANGNLTGIGELQGNTGLLFGAAANVNGLAYIDGLTTLTFTAAGNLTNAGVNVAPLVFDAFGNLTGIALISGTASLSFGASGVLVNGAAPPVIEGEEEGSWSPAGFRPFNLIPKLEEQLNPPVPVKIEGKFRGDSEFKSGLGVKRLVSFKEVNTSIDRSGVSQLQPIGIKTTGEVDITATLGLDYLTVLSDDEIAVVMQIMAGRKKNVLVTRTECV